MYAVVNGLVPKNAVKSPDTMYAIVNDLVPENIVVVKDPGPENDAEDPVSHGMTFSTFAAERNIPCVTIIVERHIARCDGLTTGALSKNAPSNAVADKFVIMVSIALMALTSANLLMSGHI